MVNKYRIDSHKSFPNLWEYYLDTIVLFANELFLQ